MKRRLILALAPAALALAAAAHAQPAGPPSGPPSSAEMKAHFEAMQKQRLEDLKTVLRLRPDQEPALTAFVEAHKPQLRTLDGPPAPKALTTPQRLDEMSKRDAGMAAEHQRMRDALAKFYAALSPDQQKVFDALERLKGPRGGPMLGHGGPGGGHGGPRMILRRHGGPGDGPDGPPPPR